MPLITLAAQAAQGYRAAHTNRTNPPQAQHATTNDGTGECFSQTECRSIGKQSPLLVLHPKTSINIDFLPHVSRKTAAHFCIMAAAMPVGITPAAAFHSINRSSASAVYIGLSLCTRHTIAEHAEPQKATSDHSTRAAINLRARHLFCTQERLLAGRRLSFELNRAHYTH